MKKTYWLVAGILMGLLVVACSAGSGSNSGGAGSTSQTESGGNSEVEQANPADVPVKLGAAYLADTGFYNTYGSVTNNTKAIISGQVEIVYYDKAGQVISINEGDSVPFYAPIKPGETGYFFRPRDVSKVAGEIDHVEVKLWYAVLEKVAPAADFSNTKWEKTADGLHVSGTVKNSGQGDCRIPTVVAIFLQAGQVVGAEETSFDAEVLAVGKEASFDDAIDSMFLPAQFDDVKFVLDCSPLSFER